MTRTYSLQQVADAYLPPDWKNPIRWLQERLRRGEITGYKLGHTWRMAQEDVDAMLARYRNATPTTPARAAVESGVHQLSFTRTTARRLGAAS
jgi:hypothetical protein